MGDGEPTTQQMRAIQAGRVVEEAELAEGSDAPEEEHAHERRAEKAAYLRDKLDEQAASEEPDA